MKRGKLTALQRKKCELAHAKSIGFDSPLELDYFRYLEALVTDGDVIWCRRLKKPDDTIKLWGGLRYTPDFRVDTKTVTYYDEVKGYMRERHLVMVKLAAHKLYYDRRSVLPNGGAQVVRVVERSKGKWLFTIYGKDGLKLLSNEYGELIR